MAPQIRMVQSSGTLMVEKIQSTLMHTIPLWKSQMVLALSTQHTMQATKAEKEVSDFTNKLLKENADKLKMASIQSAEASERSVVDLETVQHINESLISALTEVKDIQAQGHQRREEARVELQRLEGELKQALLEPRK